MGITVSGKSEFTGLIGDVGSKTAFSYLASGSGATAFSKSQTALISENSTGNLARASATREQATTTDADDTLKFTKTWTANGTVTVAEVAVFNQSSSGTMGSRFVLPSTRTITTGENYNLIIKWVFA